MLNNFKQLLLNGELDSALKMVENQQIPTGFDPRHLAIIRSRVNKLLNDKDRLNSSVYTTELKRIANAIAYVASIKLPNEFTIPTEQKNTTVSIEISEEFEALRKTLKSISAQVPSKNLQPSINCIRRLERLRLEKIASDKDCSLEFARLYMVVNLLKERYPQQANQDSNPTLPSGYTLEEQKQRLINLRGEHPELINKTTRIIFAIELLHERLSSGSLNVNDYLIKGARIDKDIELLFTH